MENKPKTELIVQLTGEDGNVFNLCSIVVNALKREGYRKEAKEVSERLWGSSDYNDALRLFSEYVEIT
ncbi:hypothetical protein [Mammaliicoccus lentus]|uniref:hypothetical protein n=1 Tax=Mammaliicoccus lentus TaxID=42858 RepID=UPI0010729F92|nr:hypothetical protein [Mammaliicoccus lentus]MBF0795233.1 hypothetical protein [Mammaliicoccus lentus]TFV14629.1 hypothetical protein E4T78_11230 [Mammaliicoccus lentus]